MDCAGLFDPIFPFGHAPQFAKVEWFFGVVFHPHLGADIAEFVNFDA